MVTPVKDLPPKPWRDIPVLKYGNGPGTVRLLCGFLQCDTLVFRPLRNALPALIHVQTEGVADAKWLRAAIRQMVAEVDHARAGGALILERLTEIVFIELLRHWMASSQAPPTGWLAALADLSLGRCLSLIHGEPRREWSVQELSKASGLSRSVLAERFESMLETSPMRYVRDWRLCLASLALRTTSRPIAAIAFGAGYGAEAAFNRAFARLYGAPPAAWRKEAKARNKAEPA